MSISKVLLYILIVISCSSCNRYNAKIEHILALAGNNRYELEKLLEYYKGNDLKYKAACYLIENLEDKYSIIPENTCIEDAILKHIQNISDSTGWDPATSQVNSYLISLSDKEFQKYKKNKIIYDIDVITSHFLINNIEQAFQAWRKLKNHHDYSFADFCRYVLPYRIGNEPLSDWRKLVLEQYSSYLDSSSSNKEIALKVVSNLKMHYNIGMSNYTYPLSFDKLAHLPYGTCEHMTQYLLFILRGLGIPSAIDFVPNWANRSSGHQWNIIIEPSGKIQEIGLGVDGKNEILYKIPKIYRYMYDYKNIYDVTNQYNIPVKQLSFKLEKQYEDSELCLCVFNNENWIPIAFTKANKNYCNFLNIGFGELFGYNIIFSYENEGKGIVYLPMIKTILGNKAISYPVIISQKESVRELIPNLSKRRKIKLYRKYPKYNNIVRYASNMVGGYFEASNSSNFDKAYVLCKIKKAPLYPLERININDSSCYRYIRYVAPDSSYVNISEFSPYNKKNKLLGNIILSDNRNRANAKYAFDGHIETFYTGEAVNAYIGIDFGRSVNIDKIIYAPRTDNNDIHIGDEYELFYWDNLWHSLGTKLATHNELIYDGVPDNALLLLCNKNESEETRIFTYENGKQIWW